MNVTTRGINSLLLISFAIVIISKRLFTKKYFSSIHDFVHETRNFLTNFLTRTLLLHSCDRQHVTQKRRKERKKREEKKETFRSRGCIISPGNDRSMERTGESAKAISANLINRHPRRPRFVHRVKVVDEWLRPAAP